MVKVDSQALVSSYPLNFRVLNIELEAGEFLASDIHSFCLAWVDLKSQVTAGIFQLFQGSV